MSLHAPLLFAPMIALLAMAAAIDWRQRRIPNWLSMVLALSGLMQSFLACATVSPSQAIGGMALGMALLLPLFIINAVGGGDVKLLAAAGAWLGPGLVFQVFVVEAVIGMVLVIAQCAAKGRLGGLFRNSALLAVNMVHIREVGVEHVTATGNECRSIDRPLPYAVPILLATMLVLMAGRA